jgi:hypothetical protein
VTPSTEVLLVLLIFALYLKDCVLMLCTNEAVLVRGVGGRWRAGFGARSWRWGGREPYLANPLLPHEPVFRLRWSLQGVGGSDRSVARPVGARDEVLWLTPGAWVTWLLLFVVIPWALLAKGPHVPLLAAAGLLYLSIAASLVCAWLVRDKAALGARAFAVLAFECLACPPYAANIVRRVVGHQRSDEDFVPAAARLLQPDRLAEANLECLARVDEQLEVEEVASHTAALLKASRLRFVSEKPGEH